MSGNYMFVMVAQGDTPVYEAEFLNTQRREDTSHLNQFIIHAALDMVDECVWGTQNMHRSTRQKRYANLGEPQPCPTTATWDAGLRAWAAPRTLRGAFGCPGIQSRWRHRQRVAAAHI